VIEKLTRDVSDRMRVARTNIDENRATPARYAVTGTPTLLVLDRGRELDRIIGAVSEDHLRRRLQRFLSSG
jgi:thioredoxin 1